MKVDIDCIRKSVPLSAYEKGTEALAGSLLSIQSRESKGKKGLTYEDLLIKVTSRFPATLKVILTSALAHSADEQIPTDI